MASSLLCRSSDLESIRCRRYLLSSFDANGVAPRVACSCRQHHRHRTVLGLFRAHADRLALDAVSIDDGHGEAGGVVRRTGLEDIEQDRGGSVEHGLLLALP